MTAQPIQDALPVDVERVAPAVEVEVDTFLTAGESGHEIAARLGMKLESLRKTLHRHGRADLLDRLSAVTTGTGGTGGNPGARLRVVPALRPDRDAVAGPACAPGSGHDPDLWFTGDKEAEAVALCRRCPAREMCLRDALDRREEWGVWGGLTTAERRPLLAPKAAR